MALKQIWTSLRANILSQEGADSKIVQIFMSTFQLRSGTVWPSQVQLYAELHFWESHWAHLRC